MKFAGQAVVDKDVDFEEKSHFYRIYTQEDIKQAPFKSKRLNNCELVLPYFYKKYCTVEEPLNRNFQAKIKAKHLLQPQKNICDCFINAMGQITARFYNFRSFKVYEM